MQNPDDTPEGDLNSKGSKEAASESVTIKATSFRCDLELVGSDELGDTVGQEGSIKQLATIGHSFGTILQMLWQYTHSITTLVKNTADSNQATLMALLTDIAQTARLSHSEQPIGVAKIEITGTVEGSEDSQSEVIKLPIYKREDLNRYARFLEHGNAAEKILHQTVIQQIVNTWERLLAELFQLQLNENPEAGAKDKTMTYKEILTYASLEEAKRAIVDKETVDFLKNKSADEQIKHFQNVFGADLSSNYPELSRLKELILRRHIIVHANGVATSEYMRRAKQLKNHNLGNIAEGKPIPLSTDYVVTAWNTTYAAGTILLHLIGKQRARTRNDKNSEESVDYSLSQSSFVALQNRQYEAAEAILMYGSKIHLQSDTARLMVLVNLAQTYKWTGRADECRALLDATDWRATNSLFQACVAALRDDFSSFCNHVAAVASQKLAKVTDFYEWPVFQEVRKRSEYDDLIKKHYGVCRTDLLSQLEPKVVDITPDTTMKAVLEYVKELKNVSKKTQEQS